MSPATRCAILLRDGMKCVWCELRLDPKASHESGYKPQLDHLLPRCEGGEDDPTNLVTACGDCNLEGEDARTPEGYKRANRLRWIELDQKAGRLLAKDVYPWLKDAGKKGAERKRRWRERAKLGLVSPAAPF